MTAALLLALLVRDELGDAIKKLRDAKDVSARYQAEYDLGRLLKPQQIPLVVREVDQGPPELRPHFLRAIRWVGGKEAIAALKPFVAKHEMLSRAEAAYAMKILGDEDGMRLIVAEFNRGGLSRDDRLVVLQHLYSYYYSGKEVPPLLRKVIETDKDEILRRQAMNALATHQDPANTAFLKKLAADEKDPLCWDALAALVRQSDPDAVEATLKAIEAGRLPVNSLSTLLYALRTAGGTDVVDRLRAALEKAEDVNVRTQLIRALADMKDSKAMSLLTKLAQDKNTSVANAALDAIIALAGRSQIPTLKKLLESEDVDRRLKAAEALIALDDPSGIPTLDAILRDKNQVYRQRAVTALTSMRVPEVVEPLLFAMSDEVQTVRTSASGGLLAALSALFPYRVFELSKVGYDAADSNAQRRTDAITRIREWWSKHR